MNPQNSTLQIDHLADPEGGPVRQPDEFNVRNGALLNNHWLPRATIHYCSPAFTVLYGDTNGDGMILLRQYLAGWDVTLGPKEA